MNRHTTHSRPSWTQLPGEALLTWHPLDGTWLEVVRSDEGRRNSLSLTSSHLPTTFTHGSGLVEHNLLLGLETPQCIELRDLDTLGLNARIQTGAGVMGVWSSGRYIYQMTTPPSRLITYDLESRQRVISETRRLDQLHDALLTHDTRWLVMVGSARSRPSVRVYALHDPLHPKLHLDGLDTRGIHSPLASHHDAQLSCWSDGAMLYAGLSRRGDEGGVWPGWRGSVAAVELESGRLVWHAEIDAELTGDWRGVMDLARDDAFMPAICGHEHRLWIGGWDASVLELDARDGALRQAHYHGGVLGTLSMHYDAAHEELVLMDERGHISALRADATASSQGRGPSR